MILSIALFIAVHIGALCGLMLLSVMFLPSWCWFPAGIISFLIVLNMHRINISFD